MGLQYQIKKLGAVERHPFHCSEGGETFVTNLLLQERNGPSV